MRLQKFLARAGVASRRKSEELIAAGRVSVDGLVVREMGSKVDPDRQRVEVDGAVVRPTAPRWIALHKPAGVLCARTDPQGRPTIYDLLPSESSALFHVGRLDYLSEGLLLLTNEGDLANRLLHPSASLPRAYAVSLVGPVASGVAAKLVSGVLLDDGPALAAAAGWRTDPSASAPELILTLEEGRNREVRRMCAAVGVSIRRLRRESFGPIALGDLMPGRHRPLTPAEIDALYRAARSARPAAREDTAGATERTAGG